MKLNKLYIILPILIVCILLINTITVDALQLSYKTDDITTAQENISNDELTNKTETRGDFEANFIKDTYYIGELNDQIYYGQGNYITYQDNQVVTCIDITTMISKVINIESLKTYQGDTFDSYPKDIQQDILTDIAISARLYNNTGDEMYLVAGQLAVWEDTGLNIIEVDNKTEKYLNEIEIVSVVIDVDYSNYIYYDTEGQDLIGFDNEQSTVTLSANDVILHVGDEYNQDSTVLHNPVATDIDQEDISSKVEIVDTSAVDTNKPGIYPVELVVNSQIDLSEVTLTNNVVVLPLGDEIDPEIPYIYAANQQVNAGESINNEYFAYDLQDGNITNQILFKYSIDQSQTGVHEQVLSVSDSDNNKASENYFLTITGLDSVVVDNTYLQASSFSVSQDQLSTATDLNELVITSGNILCQDIYTGLNLEYEIDLNDLTSDSLPGVYPVDIITEDVTVEINVTVLFNEPAIIADDVILNVGDTYDVNMHHQTATDIDATDITDDIITYQSTEVNTSIPGIYPVYFEVTSEIDPSLITVIKSNVVVLPTGDVIDGDNPYLYGANLIINQGDLGSELNSRFFAYDMKDKDITSNVTYSEVDLMTPGVQEQTLNIIDSDNNLTTFTRYITILGPDSIINNNTYLQASSFEIESSELRTIANEQLEEMIVGRGNIKAQDITTGQQLPYNLELNGFNRYSEVGSHMIDVVAGDTSKEITIEVTCNDGDCPA